MENWTWGLSLIALTVGFHVSGVVFMALVLHSIGVRVESQSLGLRRLFAILTGLIGTVGLLLAVLHGIEAGSGQRHIGGLTRSPRRKKQSSTLLIRSPRGALRD
jgi:hypothetical protein